MHGKYVCLILGLTQATRFSSQFFAVTYDPLPTKLRATMPLFLNFLAPYTTAILSTFGVQTCLPIREAAHLHSLFSEAGRVDEQLM